MQVLRERKFLQFLVLLAVFALLCVVIAPSDSNVLWRLPPLIAQFPTWITESVSFVMFDWLPIEVYDPEIEDYEEKPLMKEVTRVVSGAVLFIIEFVREVLLGGVKTIVAFAGWDWATENKWARWPALPWTVVAGGAAILGYALSGLRLALFVGAAFTYIAVFGQWEPSMQTLSFVVVAAPIAVLLGLAARRVGVSGTARSRRC